jgi:hypothetical protein
MTKKSTTARPRRKAKYFSLHESNSSGLDAAYWIYKKKKGFYLSTGEEGQIGGPAKTIADAITWGAIQYGGEYVEIDTNVRLEELFELMNTCSFEPLLHNLSRLELNGVEIDAESFKNFVIWYAECQKASAAKGSDAVV